MHIYKAFITGKRRHSKKSGQKGDIIKQGETGRKETCHMKHLFLRYTVFSVIVYKDTYLHLVTPSECVPFLLYSFNISHHISMNGHNAHYFHLDYFIIFYYYHSPIVEHLGCFQFFDFINRMASCKFLPLPCRL